MPNSLIRDGFLDSERVNSLSDAAECFFFRLLLVCDDAGRADGRIEVMRARLFPLGCRYRNEALESQLTECLAAGLVISYEVRNQRYLQVSRVQRRSPATVSKFPWKDGTYKFAYVTIETKDGKKDFVQTSLLADALPIPSGTHPGPIQGLARGHTGDGDGDGDGGNARAREAPPDKDRPALQFAHENGEFPPPCFEPLPRGLFMRELEALGKSATAEIKRIKAHPKAWELTLSKSAKELIEFLAAEKREGWEKRVKEVQDKPDNYVRTKLTRSAHEAVKAWERRIGEIRKAINGVK